MTALSHSDDVPHSDSSASASWRDAERVMHALLAEPIVSGTELEGFVLRWSDVQRGVYAHVVALYRNAFAKASILARVRLGLAFRRAQTKLLVLKAEVEKKVLDSPHVGNLPAEKYGWYLELIRHAREFGRKDLIDAEAKDEGLRRKYNSIVGGIAVRYQGERMPIRKIERFTMDADPQQREEAWMLAQAALTAKKSAIDHLATEVIALRDNTARAAGYKNYREYIHRKKLRSYSLDDLACFREAVERLVVPMTSALDAEKATRLNRPALRPWDVRADDSGLDLRPYRDLEDWLDHATRAFERVDPCFAELFMKMRRSGSLDLEVRPKKMSVGFTLATFQPDGAFIGLNADTTNPKFADCVGLHHEFGHAAHFVLMADLPVFDYINQFALPGEVMEFASFSMELLTMDAYGEYFTDPAELRAAKRYQLRRVLDIIINASAMDAFEDWVYTHPVHAIAERDAAFACTFDRFNPSIDWSAVENYKSLGWMRLPHFFQFPCYFIEYALAAIGAFSLYRTAQVDRAQAIAALKRLMVLGWSRPVGELYAEAGLRFDLSESGVKRIADFLAEELGDRSSTARRTEE